MQISRTHVHMQTRTHGHTHKRMHTHSHRHARTHTKHTQKHTPENRSVSANEEDARSRRLTSEECAVEDIQELCNCLLRLRLRVLRTRQG